MKCLPLILLLLAGCKAEGEFGLKQKYILMRSSNTIPSYDTGYQEGYHAALNHVIPSSMTVTGITINGTKYRVLEWK